MRALRALSVLSCLLSLPHLAADDPGMVENGDELAGKPVVIDAPRGKGHVLLFADNPMWRQNTQGSYALVINAIMNWDHLR